MRSHPLGVLTNQTAAPPSVSAASTMMAPRRPFATATAAKSAMTIAMSPPRDSVAAIPRPRIAIAPPSQIRADSVLAPTASAAANAIAGTIPAARMFGSPEPPWRRPSWRVAVSIAEADVLSPLATRPRSTEPTAPAMNA